jgi:hypothetical protein
MSRAYPVAKDGEWLQPIRKGFGLACCDCRLVHRLDFRIYRGRVQFRARRDNRSTSALRRHRQD